MKLTVPLVLGMTLIIIRKLLRDSRWALIAVALLLFGFQMMWVKATQRVTTQIAPLIQMVAKLSKQRTEDIERQLFSGPARVVQSAIGGDQLKFERAQDVLSIGYVHPVMQVLFCLWAIGRAAGAIAGEIERGTMELLLAQPLPRSRVILAHFCVDLLLIPALCLSLWGGLSVGTWLVGPLTVDPNATKALPFAPTEVDPEILALDVSKFGAPLLNVAALLFALSGATMALSAAGRSRWRVMGLAALITLLQFVMNIVGQIWDSVAFLRPLTVFYYYQPQQIALKGAWTVPMHAFGMDFHPPMLAVLFGIGAIGYLLAWPIFQRRDIPAPL